MFKKLLDYLCFFFVRSLVFLLEFTPTKISQRLAKAYIWTIFLVMPRLKKTALRNLEIAFPDISNSERIKIFEKSKNVLAQNIFGFAQIPKLNKAYVASVTDLKNSSETLRTLKESSDGVGILIPAMHFDAFEYLIHFPALLLEPFSILGRGFGIPVLDNWWNQRRELHGNKIFSREGGYKEIIRRLNQGENVIVMCDQNVKANHAIFVDFFGLPAATTKTIGLCAMRTGAPVAVGTMISRDDGKMEFSLEPLPATSKVLGSKDEKIRVITEAMHEVFEKQIARKPEAWFWIHRRWKTRPKGEPENIY